MKNILVSIISLLLFLSCNEKSLKKEAYLDYVKNERSNFLRTESIGEEEFIFMYKPAELVTIEQSEIDKDYSSNMKTRLIENKKFEFFNLIIRDQKENGSIHKLFKDNDLYRAKLEYMMSEMKKDFYLVDGIDTLPCILYNFEPPFKPGAELRFALCFEKKKISNDKKMSIIYNDNVLEIGVIKCDFNWSGFSSLPTLQLD